MVAASVGELITAARPAVTPGAVKQHSTTVSSGAKDAANDRFPPLSPSTILIVRARVIKPDLLTIVLLFTSITLSIVIVRSLFCSDFLCVSTLMGLDRLFCRFESVNKSFSPKCVIELVLIGTL